MSESPFCGIVTRPCQYTEYNYETNERVQCEVSVSVVASAPYAFCREHTRLMMRDVT